MTYATEFPGFTLDVPIPDGFKDVSWHNDTCPSWACEFAKDDWLYVYVDYADSTAREFPDTLRFTVVHKDEKQATHDPVFSCDDWAQTCAFMEGFLKEKSCKQTT